MVKKQSSMGTGCYKTRRHGSQERKSERGGAFCHHIHHVEAVLNILQLPIIAYVPVPYDEETRTNTQLFASLTAHDTRTSTAHPLRHAVLNVVRAIAEHRASPSPVALNPNDHPSSGSSSESLASNAPPANGAHYLLTSLTVFLSHEPCIMCSMALLHSRVKEVFYVASMEQTGGCGGLACLPRLEGVNHRFGIYKWGERCLEDSIEIDPTTDV